MSSFILDNWKRDSLGLFPQLALVWNPAKCPQQKGNITRDFLGENKSIRWDVMWISQHDQGHLFNWIWRAISSKDVCRQTLIISCRYKGSF